MEVLGFVFLVFALVCFVLGSFVETRRVNIVSLGFAFLAAAFLVDVWPIH